MSYSLSFNALLYQLLNSHKLHACVYRDKKLMVIYSVGFLIVAAVNVVMFIYLLVAVVIEVSHISRPHAYHVIMLCCAHTYTHSMLCAHIHSLNAVRGTLTERLCTLS